MDSLLPWHAAAWQEFVDQRERLPHAMLFHGQAGTGKVGFARYLGRSLLCQTPAPAGFPCGQCASCAWIAAGNHPDFMLIRPEAVQLAEGSAAEEESAESAGSGQAGEARGARDGRDAREAGDAVASEGEGARTRRAPSKEIRIEQIRALGGALNLGSHAGGRRVAVLYPADAMNVYTANALLKMLEEPPPRTVFLLVTDAPDRLLPTIVSRCRRVALGTPSAETALAWLRAQGVLHPEAGLAEYGGAPFAVLRAAKAEADTEPARAALFGVLAKPDVGASLAAAERLAKTDAGLVVGWIQRWMHDCLGYNLARRIRYYPSQTDTIARLAASLDVMRCMAYSRTLVAENRVVDHPLNGRLFVENLLLGYCRAMQRG